MEESMFSIDPVAFTIGGVAVHWYGIMIALGVLCACIIAGVREKRFGFPKDTSLNVLLCALPAAIIAARLYYVAFSWDYFRADPMQIFDIRSGGMAIYGGLIGGILAGICYAKAKKLSVGALADLAAPAIAIGQAFGRWGNFFNQEAYGAPIANESLRFFPVGVFIDAQGGWFYATFFYESVWCLALCIALLAAERKNFFHRPGDGMLWYALGYAVERVAVEGLRTDSLMLGDIRVSQLLSALLLFAAAALILRREWRASRAATLLPAALLIVAILAGFRLNFAATAALSILQMILTLFTYYTIRKKATKP